MSTSLAESDTAKRQSCFFFASWLLCFGILILRAWDRLIFSNIWGEDGPACLEIVSESGMPRFFDLLAGYFFVGERLLAKFVLWAFPLSYIPLGIALTTILVTSFVFARLTLFRYRWLIAEDSHRLLASLLLCFSPGFFETLGNLANLPSILLFLLSLTALSDLQRRLGYFDVVLAILCIFSTGTFILVLPLFIWRIISSRQFHRPWITSSSELCIVAAMGVASAFIISERNSAMSLWDALSHIPSVLFPYFVRSLLFQPWLGDEITNLLSDSHLKFWQGVIGFSMTGAFSAWFYQRRKDREVRFFALYLFLLVSWPVLGWMSRPLSLPRLSGVSELFWLDRYSVPLGLSSGLLWFFILSRSRFHSTYRTLLMCAFVASNVILNHYRFATPRYTTEPVWENTLKRLAQQDEFPANLFIKGVPPGFDWTLHLATKSSLERLPR